jgi:lysozyme family protein
MGRLHKVRNYPINTTPIDYGLGGATNILGHLFQQATAVQELLRIPEEHEVVPFEDAVTRTLALEGGGKLHKVNGDPGGLTKWGISQRAFPGLDIASLTEETAKLIYRNNYWNKVKADELPDVLASHVFDAAVNMGPNKAARLLQQSINLIATTRGGPGVTVDGGIGPQTISAVAAYKPEELTTIFRHLRASDYVRQAVEGGKGKFMFGWLNRA